jgi:CBS domain containing-hemolysin-like protein
LAILIAALAILVILSGACSASETALFSLSSMKVKAFEQSEDPRKRQVAALLSRPRELLVTVIMLSTGISILVQNVVATIFGEEAGWLLNVGIPVVLMLLFGDVIPKSIGLANNAAIAYRVAPAMDRIRRVLYPVRRVLIAVTNVTSRCMFFFLKREEEISTEELEHALLTSRETGVLNEDEAELMRGYLVLQDALVRELMRPREEILYFDMDEPLPRLIHLFVDQECSRIPVCREGLDSVLGLMSSQMFFLHQDALHTTDALLPLLKKPLFAPEAMPAKALLAQLFDRQESIALVVDEYGSISGLVALEDLVEVVVGEIVDRRDEKSRYTRSGEDVVIASGKLELAELERIFGIPLESANGMVTIGGWLIEQLGDIPKSGTQYTAEDFFFHILSAEPNRIRRVYIRRIKRGRP